MTASRATNPVTTYRTIFVRGIELFYREAGDPARPTVLLLHGFPSSSHSFRDLIPALADEYHVIAPDYPGAGHSDAPPASVFTPTFENLASVMEEFIRTIGLGRFALYMHDFGGPVGFRIAVRHPEWVDALIVQNANAYLEGVAPDLLKGIRARSGGKQTPEAIASTDAAFGHETTLFFYKQGTRHPESLNPDAWKMDEAVLQNADALRIQRALIVDYASNLDEYPRWQNYLRVHAPRTLIVWGKGDAVFLPAGAEAYERDVPDAELHFFDTGHFALEEEHAAIARKIREFLAARR